MSYPNFSCRIVVSEPGSRAAGSAGSGSQLAGEKGV